MTGAVFSLGQGIIHPYYTVALAPAIGALVGIGACELWRRRALPAARWTMAAVVALTAGVELRPAGPDSRLERVGARPRCSCSRRRRWPSSSSVRPPDGSEPQPQRRSRSWRRCSDQPPTPCPPPTRRTHRRFPPPDRPSPGPSGSAPRVASDVDAVAPVSGPSPRAATGAPEQEQGAPQRCPHRRPVPAADSEVPARRARRRALPRSTVRIGIEPGRWRAGGGGLLQGSTPGHALVQRLEQHAARLHLGRRCRRGQRRRATSSPPGIP